MFDSISKFFSTFLADFLDKNKFEGEPIFCTPRKLHRNLASEPFSDKKVLVLPTYACIRRIGAIVHMLFEPHFDLCCLLFKDWCLCRTMGKAHNDNVRVMVRVRPFNKKEFAECGGNCPPCTLTVNSETMISCTDPAHEDNVATFPFDNIFWSMPADQVQAPIPFADQPDVYKLVGQPQLDSMFDGYNGCIFAYGQTSSGIIRVQFLVHPVLVNLSLAASTERVLPPTGCTLCSCGSFAPRATPLSRRVTSCNFQR